MEFSHQYFYGSQTWGQENAVTKKLQILQNIALPIMHLQPPRTIATPLFKTSKFLKLNDQSNLQNFLFPQDNLKKSSFAKG